MSQHGNITMSVSSRRKGKSHYSETMIEVFVSRHEKVLIVTLCTLAMLRIFFFSAVFPFFNNVDEQAHFDTVVKYSKGYLPRKGNNYFSRESSELIVLYGSPEYFTKPEEFKSASIPRPLWSFSSKEVAARVNRSTDFWIARKNYEAFSVPAYYAIAGIWYNFGKVLGVRGGQLLYWIRFMNVGIYAALLLFCYLYCKSMHKDNQFLRIGVPLLLAFFPQDVFYSINSDVLSSLFFLISLYLLILVYTTERNLLFHFMTGIVVACTFLVKLSNLPILIVCSVFLLAIVRKLWIADAFKNNLPNLLLLISAVILPITLWLGWNAYALGDITGSAEKINELGWTMQPVTNLFSHPIFTLKGVTYFIAELAKTFWRGEFVWGLERIASSGIDLFLVISSCIFLFVSVIGRLLPTKSYNSSHWLLDYMNVLIVFLFVLFLGILSTIYGFGKCWYPSQEHPYFTSGRLMSGAVVPFLVLYLDGLGLILNKITRRISPLAVVLFIALLITYSEVQLTYRVLQSPYNWFHLP